MKEETKLNIAVITLGLIITFLLCSNSYYYNKCQRLEKDTENKRLKHQLMLMSDSLNFTHRYCFRLSENEWKYCEGWTPDTCKKCKKLF